MYIRCVLLGKVVIAENDVERAYTRIGCGVDRAFVDSIDIIQVSEISNHVVVKGS